MSQFIDFTLPSTVPGRTLHGFRCVPEGQVRAVLQLSHGMVEFIDRYRPLAEYLADRGILVTGHDHLGHGASIRTKEDYGYFAEPDGNRAVLADLHAVTVLDQGVTRTCPHFAGTLALSARQYLCEYGREPGREPSSWAPASSPRQLAKVAKTSPGAGSLPRLALLQQPCGQPSFMGYNKGWRAAPLHDWLNREAEVDKYLAEERCTFLTFY